MFAGIFQILHTPFTPDGAIDWASYERQLEFCLAAGVHGVVTPAMASEFFTLSDQERLDVAEFVIRNIDRRVPVIICVQGVTIRHAQLFAAQATELGAEGMMAMPPYLRKPSRNLTVEYFRELASYGRPIIIQNAPAPIGTPLETEQLGDLIDEGIVQYIKEETPPILQRIGNILATSSTCCKGVFGGANGLYLIDELKRGSCGNMPAGGLVDMQTNIYNLYKQGQCEKAVVLHNRLLPLLSFAAMYGVSFHKFVLWRRNVLSTPTARDPQAPPLNREDTRAISEMWQDIADVALEDFPFLS